MLGLLREAVKHRLRLFGLLFALLGAGDALARDSDEFPRSDLTPVLSGRPWYVSGMFSYVDADSDRGTDAGLGGMVSVGKKVAWALALEATGYYSVMNAKSGRGSAELHGYGASALLSPFKAIPDLYGIASLMYGRSGDMPGPRHAYDSTVFDVGLGYLQPITPRILLRTEARYRTEDKGGQPTGAKGGHSNFNEGVYNIGLLFPFGDTAVATPPVPEALATVVETGSTDDDNDGVPDDHDHCPGSPAGAVDAQGCTIAGDSAAAATSAPTPPAAEPGCRTPEAGEAVDELGCAAGPAPPPQ